MNNEPVITSELIGTFVGAILALLVAFNVPLTDAQTAAVLVAVPASFNLVAAIYARSKVSPVV